MIDAPTADEAGKVLQEIGYGEFSATSDRELGQALARKREALFQDLYRYVPDKAVVDVFKVKYDYHNLKALLKAQAMGIDGERLLLDAGRVPAASLERAVREGTEATLFFVIQMSGVNHFSPNDITHPAFGAALREAAAAGVHVRAYDCVVAPDHIAIHRPVPVEL